MRNLVAPSLGLCIAASLSACGDGASTQASASAAPTASVAAPAPKPTAVAMCDMPGADDHLCFEYLDESIASDREAVCTTGLKRNADCPTKDRIGSCRLSDGSIRYTYPPKATEQADKACREAKGKYAAGGVAPPPDPKIVVRCEGKVEGGCEEETSFTEARAKQAEDECSTYGGKSSRGEVCVRDQMIATCDLDGPRMLVFSRTTSMGAAERYCADRRGKFDKATAASASASASASAAPDLDAPEPKADVIIRSQ
ncbi:MAG TPA: hypothetical protein VL400_05775 [Polyangiaceae bacterium]|nr:hypothetical protein [Polyangiaceae bacterium]